MLQITHADDVQAYIAETEAHPMASENIGRRKAGCVPWGAPLAAPNQKPVAAKPGTSAEMAPPYPNWESGKTGGRATTDDDEPYVYAEALR